MVDREKDGFVGTEDGSGQVRINNDVITVIAARAATGVDGVAGLVGKVSDMLAHTLGKKGSEKGVRVDVQDNVASLELSIICKYGFNLPKVCAEVQDAVKRAVEQMTGLAVAAVDVNVQGLALEEPEASPAAGAD